MGDEYYTPKWHCNSERHNIFVFYYSGKRFFCSLIMTTSPGNCTSELACSHSVITSCSSSLIIDSTWLISAVTRPRTPSCSFTLLSAAAFSLQQRLTIHHILSNITVVNFHRNFQLNMHRKLSFDKIQKLELTLGKKWEKPINQSLSITQILHWKSHKTELPLKLQHCIIHLLVCLLQSSFFLFKASNWKLETFAVIGQIINMLLLLHQLRLNKPTGPLNVFCLYFLSIITVLYQP